MTQHFFTKVARRATTGVVAVATAASLTACMSDDSSSDDVITIGATEAQKDQWKVFQEQAEEAGLNVKVENFSDYNVPNRALAEGELDVNQFQHIQFLAESNVSSGDNLVPFGATSTFPMGIYSKDATTVEEVADEGTVVIPNDPTNQGRAIKVLAAAGLVTVRDDNLLTPTPADIVEDESDVTVTPVEASQTAVAYQDGQIAIINNNYLTNAGVDANSAIFTDDPDDPAAQPYINVWVTTEENKDNEDYQKLVDVWNTDEVQEAVAKDTANTAVASDLSAEELQEILADTEKKVEEQGTAEDANE